jgi:hypothetical protein
VAGRGRSSRAKILEIVEEVAAAAAAGVMWQAVEEETGTADVFSLLTIEKIYAFNPDKRSDEISSANAREDV